MVTRGLWGLLFLTLVKTEKLTHLNSFSFEGLRSGVTSELEDLLGQEFLTVNVSVFALNEAYQPCANSIREQLVEHCVTCISDTCLNRINQDCRGSGAPAEASGAPDDAVSESGDPVEVVPPSEDPVDAVPPSEDPADVVPPSEDPVDAVPPSEDPADVVPPSEDPVDAVPPYGDPVDTVPASGASVDIDKTALACKLSPVACTLAHIGQKAADALKDTLKKLTSGVKKFLGRILPRIRLPRIKLPRIRLPRIRLPRIRLPRIRIPRIRLPRIRLPRIRLPRIRLPRIRLPRIRLPRIRLPRIRIPRIRLPRIRVPRIRLPRIRVPRIRLPRIRVPRIRLPRIRLPRIRVPRIRLPRIRVPRIRLPRIRVPRIRLPRIRVPRIRLPRIRVPRIRLPRIRLRIFKRKRRQAVEPTCDQITANPEDACLYYKSSCTACSEFTVTNQTELIEDICGSELVPVFNDLSKQQERLTRLTPLLDITNPAVFNITGVQFDKSTYNPQAGGFHKVYVGYTVFGKSYTLISGEPVDPSNPLSASYPLAKMFFENFNFTIF